MKLILKDDMDKYVVKRLNDEFEFVHNNEDNSNWFNQKTLAKMFGVSVSAVSHRLNTYMKRIKANKNNSRNPQSFVLSLKIENSKAPVKFYNFKAVTWFAHVLNTQEAFDMLEWIDSSLNTMFNVAVGKDSINSNEDWLKEQMKVKQFQAGKCKETSNILYKAGLKHIADKNYSEYRKLEAEALKFKEMYLDYVRLDKMVATVRSDKTEQLKLI